MMDAKRSRFIKLLVLASALTMFAACGEEGGTPTGGGGETHPKHDFTLVTEGHLTVGSDIPYPPFEFEDDSGRLTGFDVDLVREIADRIGLENADDDWLSTDFDTIFQQLQSGTTFDVIVAAVTGYAPKGSPAAETVADRRKLVDFSVQYYPSLQSLTVDTSKNPDIKSVDDLPDGARVAVQAATTGAFFAQETLKGAELVEFPKSPEMYQALQAGQVVGVMNDLPASLGEIEGKPNLEVVQELETGEGYAIGVAKDNTELKDAIDEALNEMFKDGTYADIWNEYFPDQPLPDFAQE
jgi:polar amino acid transport system substrate-binding protein